MSLSSDVLNKLSRAFGVEYAEAADETVRTLGAFHPFLVVTFRSAGEIQAFESSYRSGSRKAGPGGRKIVTVGWPTDDDPPRGPQEPGPGTDTDGDRDTDTDEGGSRDKDRSDDDGFI